MAITVFRYFFDASLTQSDAYFIRLRNLLETSVLSTAVQKTVF